MSLEAARSFKEAMGRDWLAEHRNRFVVAYYNLKWYVFRVEYKSGVHVVVKCNLESTAHEVADQLNDMYEDGKIV